MEGLIAFGALIAICIIDAIVDKISKRRKRKEREKQILDSYLQTENEFFLLKKELNELRTKAHLLNAELNNRIAINEDLKKQIEHLNVQNELLNSILDSHKESMPWLAGMMADYELISLAAKYDPIDEDKVYVTYKQFENFSHEESKKIIAESKVSTYQLKYLLALYPEFERVLKNDYKNSHYKGLLDYDKIRKTREKQLEEFFSSHKESMPRLANMMADYITYDIEFLAMKLDWGESHERAKKVASIREIRAEAKRRIEEAKLATYQLEYLISLYPQLEDVLEVEYRELELTGEIPEGDPARKFLSREEWMQLSDTEKNQLALDRYVENRKKSKWQIGRDYELSVAHEYLNDGYIVDTHGSYMGLEDMGRDIIASKDGMTTLIQCKYWSNKKQIHENHIFQLFGSMVSYCIENNVDWDRVNGILVTNIEISDTARKVAEYLGISISERHAITDFPRIKCNTGHSESGEEIKIYHLPMDEQYDSTKIDKPGEFYAFTVKEAEDAGFRRAYKHFIK